MTKKDLMTGDIVVLKSGHLAVVIRNEKADYLLWQKGGWEDLDMYYDDDMVNTEEEDAIMQVYRAESYAHGFSDFGEEELIYERDYTWTRPTEEEMAAKAEAARIEREAMMAEWRAAAEKAREDNIAIISQAFYGNRTGTEIKRKNVDRFILGCLDDDLPVSEPIDRTITRVPQVDNLVLVYNKYQEEKWIEYKKTAWEKDNYVIKPLAIIPELNLELYSRCIACRMDERGELQSLEDEDYEKLVKYLAE